MAFTSTNTTQTGNNIIFRDQQHAARMFTDDQFRLAPKLDFLFHVAFGINPAAVKDTALLQRHGTEINMLVKSASLPKFEMTTEIVNQYNRKKVIQTQHKPGDFTIKFHDDNMGLINKLWQNYYSYYYADSHAATVAGAYNRNAIRSADFIYTPYGLDNGSIGQFFNYIIIYQMARHEYTSYKLINPLIKSWDGHSVDYSSTKPHDISMTFQCEAVAYGSGTVTAGDPEGFAQEHYDNVQSPILGYTNVSSASPSFVGQQDNRSADLQNKQTQVNNAENRQQSTAPADSNVTTSSGNQNAGGKSGYEFPQSGNKSEGTTAQPSTL